MANIIEIDLEKHLVIPIPAQLSKNDLALLVAQHFEYQGILKNVVRKTETLEEFTENIKGKVLAVDYFVIQNDGVTIIYDIIENIQNPETAYEFGISKAVFQIGDLLRTIFKKIEDLKVADDIRVLKETAETNANNINSFLENIKGI